MSLSPPVSKKRGGLVILGLVRLLISSLDATFSLLRTDVEIYLGLKCKVHSGYKFLEHDSYVNGRNRTSVERHPIVLFRVSRQASSWIPLLSGTSGTWSATIRKSVWSRDGRWVVLGLRQNMGGVFAKYSVTQGEVEVSCSFVF